MGPRILFDKSFLQSLSIDESVWFDHLFSPVICPLFYVETLADLEKSLKKGRTPEQEVGIIANKFPEVNGNPCMYHGEICISELLGKEITMDARIPLGGGRPVISNQKQGIVYDESPESEAFHRWQSGKFLEVERSHAKSWREGLLNVDLNSFAEELRNLGIDSKRCKSLSDAKVLSDSLLLNPRIQNKLIELPFKIINIPQNQKGKVLTRWLVNGCRPLYYFSPYTFFIMNIEIFFNICLVADHISNERPSNRVDIAYLFYLPFSNIFVSSDKLHKKCTKFFLRENQLFIWGQELKDDLKKINEYYTAKPESEKEQGLYSLASYPPLDKNFLVCELWDKIFPNWRQNASERKEIKSEDSDDVSKFNKMADAPTADPKDFDFDEKKLDFITIKRMVRKKKGSWWQVPKDLPPDKDIP